MQKIYLILSSIIATAIHAAEVPCIKIPVGTIKTVGFSNTGAAIAHIGNQEQSETSEAIKIIDTPSTKVIKTINFARPLHALTIPMNATNAFAIGRDGALFTIDFNATENDKIIRTDIYKPANCSFYPLLVALATSASNGHNIIASEGRRLCAWRDDHSLISKATKLPSPITALAVTPNFDGLAGLANGQVCIFSPPGHNDDISVRTINTTLTAKITAVACNNQLTSAIAGAADGTLCIVNVRDNKILTGKLPEAIQKIQISEQDNVALISVKDHQHVYMIDLQTLKISKAATFNKNVKDIAIAPQGTFYAAALVDDKNLYIVPITKQETANQQVAAFMEFFKECSGSFRPLEVETEENTIITINSRVVAKSSVLQSLTQLQSQGPITSQELRFPTWLWSTLAQIVVGDLPTELRYEQLIEILKKADFLGISLDIIDNDAQYGTIQEHIDARKKALNPKPSKIAAAAAGAPAHLEDEIINAIQPCYLKGLAVFDQLLPEQQLRKLTTNFFKNPIDGVKEIALHKHTLWVLNAHESSDHLGTYKLIDNRFLLQKAFRTRFSGKFLALHSPETIITFFLSQHKARQSIFCQFDQQGNKQRIKPFSPLEDVALFCSSLNDAPIYMTYKTTNTMSATNLITFWQTHYNEMRPIEPSFDTSQRPTALALSNNGEHAVIGFEQGDVIFIDINKDLDKVACKISEQPKPIKLLPSHHTITSISLSADGNRRAFGTQHGLIYITNAQGTKLAEHQFPAPVKKVLVTAHGDVAIVQLEGVNTVFTVDLTTAAVVHENNVDGDEQIVNVAISPEGELFAIATNTAVYVLPVLKKEVTAFEELPRLYRQIIRTNSITKRTPSPMPAATTTETSDMQIDQPVAMRVDVQQPYMLQEPLQTATVTIRVVSTTPPATQVVSTTTTATTTPPATRKRKSSPQTASSADADWDEEDVASKIYLRDIHEDIIPLNMHPHVMALSGNGGALIAEKTVNPADIKLLRENGQKISIAHLLSDSSQLGKTTQDLCITNSGSPVNIQRCVLSHDGNIALIATPTYVRLFDITNPAAGTRLQCSVYNGHGGLLALSGNGQRIFITHEEQDKHELHIYENKKRIRPLSFAQSITALTASQDGNYVAISLADKTINIYDMHNLADISCIPLNIPTEKPITTLIFANNNKQIVAGNGSRCWIHDIQTNSTATCFGYNKFVSVSSDNIVAYLYGSICISQIAANGKLESFLKRDKRRSFEDDITAMSITADGQQILVITGNAMHVIPVIQPTISLEQLRKKFKEITGREYDASLTGSDDEMADEVVAEGAVATNGTPKRVASEAIDPRFAKRLHTAPAAAAADDDSMTD